MQINVKHNGKSIPVTETALDRAIRYVAPRYGLERFRARAMAAVVGGYVGGRRDRPATKGWTPRGNDPDTDILTNLADLRGRCRDSSMNNPIGAAAINTKVVNVVGAGLQLHANIDAELLKMTEDEADAWEANTQRWFRIWANNPSECDAARTLTFGEKQNLAFRQVLDNGDVFVNKPFIERAGCVFGLKLQEIEADRICNEHSAADKDGLASGVEYDPPTGAPIRYHVAKFHPGALRNTVKREWDKIEAFNKNGKRNIYHLFETLRPGQRRGVPMLATVLEPLKSISNLTDSELQAALLDSLFTVFVKSESGEVELDLTPAGNNVKTSDEDSMKMGSGNIFGMQPGQSIETANPNRPNVAFEPFFIAIVAQLGAAIGIPYEVLMKRFTSSYSASKAALLEAWKFFMVSRQWLVARYCQPVYCDWMDEAVARWLIDAPGYFDDPLIRQAYQGALWIGPAKGMIQEQAEVGAALDRAYGGISTLEYEAAQIMGLDWEQIYPQQVKERNRRKRDGLLTDKESLSGNMSPSQPDKNLDEGKEPDETDKQNTPENEDADYAVLQMKSNTYGIAVRSGAITPQPEDETQFRKELRLPAPSDAVKSAWEKDGSIRRPITLQSGTAVRAEERQIDNGKGTQESIPAEEQEP